MENEKYALIIEEQEYEIPPLVVKTFGEEDFAKLISDVDSKTRYELLKRFDHIFSCHVGMVVDPDYFKGRGTELSSLVSLAAFLAERQQYEKANKLLYKSIKEFGDVYSDHRSKGAEENKTY